MKILNFLKAKSTTILAIVCAVLVVISTVLFFSNKSLKSDNDRLKNNQANLIQKDSSRTELEITRKEYKESNLPIKKQIDSTAQKNKINPKRITEYSSYKSFYSNNDTVKALNGKPLQVEGIAIGFKDSSKVKYSLRKQFEKELKDADSAFNATYKIPVFKDSVCWGMEGYMISKDSASELYITKRTASSSIELLILRKRFLGFLWWKKSREYKTFSKCGEIKIDKIKFAD